MREQSKFITSKRGQKAHASNIMTSLDMIVICATTSGAAILLWSHEKFILTVVLSQLWKKCNPFHFTPLQCCCLSRRFNRLEIKATRHAKWYWLPVGVPFSHIIFLWLTWTYSSKTVRFPMGLSIIKPKSHETHHWSRGAFLQCCTNNKPKASVDRHIWNWS